MLDQYVRVTFPTDRPVWVDGKQVGTTNKEFQVETGEHSFHLGDPRDYSPDRYVETIDRTLPGQPCIIAFKLRP